MIDLRDPAERDAAAGEYVLGTLDAADHAQVLAALPADRALRAAVYAWQDRLLALSGLAEPAVPLQTTWPRIEGQLGPAAPRAASPSPGAKAVAGAVSRWWQSLALWQGLSAAAATAALVLAVLLVQQRADPPAATRYVALLQSPDGQSTGWIVELQADRVRLVPTAAGAPVPAGRSLQFWTKLEGAAGPTSLGLVRAGQTVELPLSALPGVGPRQLFEITLEPEGGSTIGRPTGPILFVGKTVAL